MSDFNKGYRAGVMAERKRAMLIALRATTIYGNPSDEGHNLAHQIGRAGRQIPKPNADDPGHWTVFGERRLVRDVPSFLESSTTPFTRAGMKYIIRLEESHCIKDVVEKRLEFINEQGDKNRIGFLEEQLADAPERILELEKLVETLSLQLTGIID